MAHVPQLSRYFEAFAAEHLANDDSTLAAFARFIASKAGSGLRLNAVAWIDAAIGRSDSPLRRNAGSDLAELARTMLAEHRAELVGDGRARDALISVIGRMVRDQVPYALALQDRVRGLR